MGLASERLVSNVGASLSLGLRRESRGQALFECPESYRNWFCLNGATCFAAKIGDSFLYSCWCQDGFHGERCNLKQRGTNSNSNGNHTNAIQANNNVDTIVPPLIVANVDKRERLQANNNRLQHKDHQNKLITPTSTNTNSDFVVVGNRYPQRLEQRLEQHLQHHFATKDSSRDKLLKVPTTNYEFSLLYLFVVVSLIVAIAIVIISLISSRKKQQAVEYLRSRRWQSYRCKDRQPNSTFLWSNCLGNDKKRTVNNHEINPYDTDDDVEDVASRSTTTTAASIYPCQINNNNNNNINTEDSATLSRCTSVNVCPSYSASTTTTTSSIADIETNSSQASISHLQYQIKYKHQQQFSPNYKYNQNQANNKQILYNSKLRHMTLNNSSQTQFVVQNHQHHQLAPFEYVRQVRNHLKLEQSNLNKSKSKQQLGYRH